MACFDTRLFGIYNKDRTPVTERGIPMELRVLQYFLAVAREESITRAAESLHITQPTLSRQLSQLEEELGTRLFERGTRHITLTPDGLLLRRRAEEISELVDKTRQELAFQDETLAGTVALGSGELEAVRVMPRLFQAFRMRYPLVDYTLYSGTADDVKERMDRGLLDAGILLEPVDVEKYEFIRLPVREQWIALMPADDPLAAKSAVTVDDLAGRPLLLPQRPRVLSEVANWFGDRCGDLDVPFTCNMSTNAAVLVAGGMGIAVTIEGSLPFLDTTKLCTRPLDPPMTTSTVFAWKRHQPFGPAAAKFLEFARTFWAEFPPQG